MSFPHSRPQAMMLREGLRFLLVALGLLTALAFHVVFATHAYVAWVNIFLGGGAVFATLLGVDFFARGWPENTFKPLPFWLDLTLFLSGGILLFMAGYFVWTQSYTPEPILFQQLWNVLFLFAWSSTLVGGFGASIFNTLMENRMKGQVA